jgi:hypothetical protein
LNRNGVIGNLRISRVIKLYMITPKTKKRTNKLKSLVSPFLGIGALGANRTRDTRIRNPVLYPLSYEGWWNILNQAE